MTTFEQLKLELEKTLVQVGQCVVTYSSYILEGL